MGQTGGARRRSENGRTVPDGEWRDRVARAFSGDERSMKVLYLCTDGIDLAAKSGGAIHMRSFVRALGEIGHQVALVSTDARPPACLSEDFYPHRYHPPPPKLDHTL